MIVAPRKNRSGAAARNPLLASQSACSRTSALMPIASWMTTTPGQGPAPAGRARYAGIVPGVGIEISLISTWSFRAYP